MNNDIPAFLKRAAEKSGFDRVVYNDAKTPTHPSGITVLPLFCDIRELSIASAILMSRIKEKSKYLIIASWPGMQGLFDCADEYWSLSNDAILGEFYKESCGFGNLSKHTSLLSRNLNLYLEDVIKPDALSKYYDNGITSSFGVASRTAEMRSSTTVAEQPVSKERQSG